ncbi:transglycosylase domain-containing protein [Paenibacillus sp. CC-CFT747]|nr:transglycosylase domain-containing protein [Paenibacillus sp. CC-CFT747]
MANKRTSSPSGKKKKPFSWSKLLSWSLVAAALAIICGLAGYIFIIFNGQKELKANMDKLNMPQASTIYDVNKNEVTKLGVNRQVVENIPEKVTNAFVATEDRRFWEHSGVDFWSIGRALVKDVVARSAVEGGSTITQQLAKNMFLNADKTLFRKGTEMSIAMALEGQFTKQQILEMYLNQINFGKGALGIQAAAKRYFGVDKLDNLETWQIATLAGIPKAPSNYNPIDNPERSKDRRAVVLQLMADQGYITQAEKEQAAKVEYDANKAVKAGSTNKFLTYTDYVLKEASETYQIEESVLRSGGYKIYTTLNPTAQQNMEDTYNNDKFFQKDMNGLPMQSSMVIVDNKDGGIVAMIGGRDYESKGRNRALDPRSPGSAMKPLVVYAPAIESGEYGPNSMLKDEPINIGGYAPKDLGAYRGQVDMTTAIQKSINVPAVWLLNEIGLKRGRPSPPTSASPSTRRITTWRLPSAG